MFTNAILLFAMRLLAACRVLVVFVRRVAAAVSHVLHVLQSALVFDLHGMHRALESAIWRGFENGHFLMVYWSLLAVT